MGYKTFSAGEVLTASNVMTYLMNQAVIGCTSGTRPGSPQAGMTIFETDTRKLRVYDSGWVDIAKTDVANTFSAAQTFSAGLRADASSSVNLFFSGGNLNFRPALADSGANMGIQSADFNGDTNYDGLKINGSDGVAIATNWGQVFKAARTGGVEIDLFTGAATKSINFRPALADNGANMGIQSVDWNSDGNYDGLRINGGDGVGLAVATAIVARFKTGEGALTGDTHYVGRAAIGATGSRLKIEAAGAGYVVLASENQAGTLTPLYLRGSHTYFQDGASITQVTIGDDADLVSLDTPFFIRWADGAGAKTTSQVRLVSGANINSGLYDSHLFLKVI